MLAVLSLPSLTTIIYNNIIPGMTSTSSYMAISDHSYHSGALSIRLFVFVKLVLDSSLSRYGSLAALPGGLSSLRKKSTLQVVIQDPAEW